MTTTALTVNENQVGELQEEINTLVTKTNELIASSSVDPSVAALLQSMTVIIKLLAKQNLNVNNSSNHSTVASNNGPAPMAAAPPPPPPIQQLPPLNVQTDDEQRDRVIMPIEINSEIQAKCKEMLEKRRKSVRIEDSSSNESSQSSDSESEKKKKPLKKNSVSDRSKTTTRTSSTRKPQPRKRSSISSRGSADKQNGCTIS
uniref:Uncharacterized protein n=1 Tax=Panagrolaimus superbus TaxID=310955 RepID=A0A914Z5X0_9BILA